MHITGENTVNSYASVHLVVFYAYYWWKHGNWGLPISQVAPLDQLLPCHWVVPVDFPNTCPMKIVRIFYRIIARYGRDIYMLTQCFPNQQWCNKSTYDLVERLLFPLSFYRRYIKFTERYSDVSKFRMIFNFIYLSSI